VAGVVVFFGESPGLPWLNHDAANALYVGCRVLAGDVLYLDWLYYVMPPVVFLSSAVCGVAHATGLAPPTVLHLAVVAAAALGLRVLRRASPGGARFLGLALGYLVLVAANLLFLERAGSLPRAFGQREHLFALLFVPYLFWRGSEQAASPATRCLVLALGFVMMVKPHLAAAVVAVEVACWRDSRRRSVWVPLAVGAVLPFAALLVHAPASVGAFFERALTYHASDAYDPYGRAFGEFFWSVRHAQVLVLMGVAAGAGLLARRRRLLPARWPVCVGCALAVLYLGFLQQGKFYFYHLIPTASVAFVAAVVFVARLAGALESERLRRAALTAVTVPLLALLALDMGALVELFRESPAGRPRAVLPLLAKRRFVALVTPSVEGAIFRHALAHDLTLMRPWTSNYTVPALLRIEEPDERERALRAYFEPIALRIQAERPELVLFSPAQENRAMGGRSMHDVFVADLRLFPSTDYRLLRVVGGWHVYEHGAAVPARNP
jgi:hypothetical protein